MFLPGKSNFAIAQEAARPNKVFDGTAMAAVMIVRRRAPAPWDR
jgi:hypothetical protein